MTLWISNEDVEQIIDMDQCIETLQEGLEEYYRGEATARPRIDVWTPCDEPQSAYRWGSMEGTSKRWKVFALRIKSDVMTFPKGEGEVWTAEYYCVRPGRFLSLVLLFSLKNGEPLAVMNDGVIQHMRVGATAGLGAKYMALADADTVGMLGSGGMARTHAMAFAAVRPLKRIKVYSPTKEHRQAYAATLAERLGLEVIPVGSAEEAVRGSQIVACCTDSIVPVLRGEWLEEGAFLTTVKGAMELDDTAIDRIDLVLNFGLAADPVLQSHQERTGPLSHSMGFQAYVAGSPEDYVHVPTAYRARPIPRNRYIGFKELLTGKVTGRLSGREIVTVAGGGIQGIQFASIGGLTYYLIKEKGLGREIPTEWFLQDIRN